MMNGYIGMSVIKHFIHYRRMRDTIGKLRRNVHAAMAVRVSAALVFV
jgi:hypothetical protein